MPKDTKSSGYNKAPACESRGFGHKKEGENFDTPSFYLQKHRPDFGRLFFISKNTVPISDGCFYVQKHRLDPRKLYSPL